MEEAEKAGGQAEAEYESDLDGAPLPAARRRAAARDDEEDEDEGGGGSGWGSPAPSSTVCDSESDPDGQGAPELYDDDGDEGVFGTEEECGYTFKEREAGGVGCGDVDVEVAVAPEDEGKYEAEESAAVEGEEEESPVEGEAEEVTMEGEEEVKKGSEPYDVPTAGAFYEHDTRFQGQEDGGRGHQRQVLGGQKIWNPKVEAVWVHDRFNEINSHANTKNEYHVHVRMMQSVDNGNFEGTKSYNHSKSFDCVQTQSHSYYGNVKGYNDERNVYREKGSRNYQSHRMTSGISSAQDNRKSYSRSQNAEVSSNAGVGKHSSQTLSLQHEQTLHCKQTFRSDISSAPPTFYSSRASHQGLPFIPREKVRRVTFNKLFSSAVHKAHNSLTPQSHPVFRRKAFVPSVSVEHGTAVDSNHIVPIDVMACSALHPMSTSHNYSKDSEFWDQGRDLDIAETTIPCTEPQIAVYQQRSVQRPILPTPRASSQIFVHKDTSNNKIRSHPQTRLISSSDDGKVTTPPETNSSVVLSALTVQDDMKEAERTYFLDGGSFVVDDTGARCSTLDEPGSTSTPAKLPVMLFSGLHPMGPGFSSVMVLPGFVGQHCDGDSEMGLMTWLPISTGATGVQEGSSSPLNFGKNCPQPSELASSLTSLRDHAASNDPISLTSQEIPEAVSHEPVHHQNRTRRYSEMKFAL
ncbi:protein MLN51 homolog isoform X2 [Panicum hallii]|uniref:protein MLN51 homolog isoform X2 n=1 Tax=Panicum hallii TaxID=206008 RepID=UPI000DF4E925|nr:protein MLN51 homolog isoform X2 [Panicum hallii]